jgi:hypothetical protein
MKSILSRGVIRNGRVEVPEPIDVPDGTVVVVTTGAVYDNETMISGEAALRAHMVTTSLKSFQFMTEDEQEDDPIAVQKWVDDLQSIPPLPESPEGETELRAWDDTMRAFNVEAVRKQFEEGQR